MYSVVIEQSVVKSDVVSVLVSASDEPEAVLIDKADCQMLWDELKCHTFRRDNHNGNMAYKIFKAIERVANSEDYAGPGYHSKA